MSLRMRLRSAVAGRLPAAVKPTLRRLLPDRVVTWRPATRDLRLAMPVPPPGLGPNVRSAASPPTIRLSAPFGAYVPRLLEARGVAGYEPETMAAFLAAISLLGASDVLDVGANVGIFSIVGAATTGARITGFEPTPDLAASFGETCRANRLTCDVEAIALGRTTGRATLFLSSLTDSSNSLREGFRRAQGAIEVPVERLDAWCARTGRHPAVLKIDTETTEPDVLEGAPELLAGHRPWIVCEVLAGRTEAGLGAILQPLGYRLHALGPDGPEPRVDLVGDPTGRIRDWLFTPIPLPATFSDHYHAWREAIRATARP